MSDSLGRRQALTLLLLFGGYAGYYFCRSDLSVAMPLLIEELGRHGYSSDSATIRLGAISSWGVLFYAAGKFGLAGFADVWGGRRSFVAGLAGAVLFTLLFAATGTLPIWTMAWIGNRLLQSIGWAGLVKVCSRWFSFSSYGTVLGILSLSYLIGDALARQWMSMLIRAGYGWRTLFYFAAAVAGSLLLANLLLLRNSRTELGFTEPVVNPLNLFSADTDLSLPGAHPLNSLLHLVRTLFSYRAFWIVCALSLGCTLIRETFNTWIPTYLRLFLHFTKAGAASASAIFPAVGAVSVVLSGWLSDKLGARGRALVMCVGLTFATAGLLALTYVRSGTTGSTPVWLIGAVAFTLLGPYSYLAGAMALDFGGRQAGAASSGIIDGVGYLGGVMAGDTVARVSVAFGWQGVFAMLAGVSLLSAAAAGLLLPTRGRSVPLPDGVVQ